MCIVLHSVTLRSLFFPRMGYAVLGAWNYVLLEPIHNMIRKLFHPWLWDMSPSDLQVAAI